MNPNFPEFNGPTGTIVLPTPEPLLGQTVDKADWKATFEGGPPIDSFLVFLAGGPPQNSIVSFYPSDIDRVQYTPDASRLIRSAEGCELRAFDLPIGAG